MNALFILIDQIISIYLYTLIIYVIITLLIQFEIVNRYNRIIDFILRGLIALHEPLLIKIRKYIPFFGGMDFSPVIVILLLSFIRNLLIDQIISIYLYSLIIYVIITVLVHFVLINRYNRIIDIILRGLIAIHEPLLIKIRKYIPFIGGMDFSPVIVILLLSFIRNLLLDYRLSL